jgi:hypothetical protein
VGTPWVFLDCSLMIGHTQVVVVMDSLIVQGIQVELGILVVVLRMTAGEDMIVEVGVGRKLAHRWEQA